MPHTPNSNGLCAEVMFSGTMKKELYVVQLEGGVPRSRLQKAGPDMAVPPLAEMLRARNVRP